MSEKLCTLRTQGGGGGNNGAYIDLYSAASDAVKWSDDDGTTWHPAGTTDSSGLMSCFLPVGTLLLKSSVAKNPDSLSTAYTKTVSISGNGTVYFMPANSLYWYGCNNGIQTMSTANGWTIPSSAYVWANPSYRTNSILINPNANPQVCGIGSANGINDITTLYCIGNKSSGSQYGIAGMAAPTSKTFAQGGWAISSTPVKYSLNLNYGNTYYPAVGGYNTSATTIYAMWYE